MSNSFNIAGIGEVLWDINGEQKNFGGAPGNFACHCKNLGAHSFVISNVGSDTLGSECLHFLTQHGVDISGVSVSDQYETGVVNVTLDAVGKPKYIIKQDVAWDHIPCTEKMEIIANKLDAICFGSLSQRSPVTRETISHLVS